MPQFKIEHANPSSAMLVTDKNTYPTPFKNGANLQPKLQITTYGKDYLNDTF